MGRMGVWLLVGMVGMLIPVHGQDQIPGFISIDCGAPNDYYDIELGIYYKKDEGFVDSGENRQISTLFINENKWQQSKNLRFFPNGTRNCYTLRPEQGKGNTYLIRTLFYYGNYDNKNQQPIFDLHIGTDYWTTVNTSNWTSYEIIHVPTTDNIQVCLINTGNGVPYISALELRLLDSSIYLLNSASLSNHWRYDIGSSVMYRYPQDIYDRLWSAKIYNSTIPINITWTPSLSDNNDAYRVPAEVLGTAQRATDANSSIHLSWPSNSTNKWCIYFHFAEIESLPSGQKREFTISVNGKLAETVTLEYLKPLTVASPLVSGSKINLSIKATPQSGRYPPILNAVEFFTIVELRNILTAMDDITAINDIKKRYSIYRDSWQGDLCAPRDFIWDGLECSYDNPPRIISLNLSSSQLMGDLAASLSDLLALVSFNLSENNFTGSIPESLQKKIDDKQLQLRVEGNPHLCLEDSCKPKKKRNSYIIPVIAAASGSVAILLVALAIIWRCKCKNKKGHREGTIKLKNRPFSYTEVLKITDNFKTVIGEGGFGKVYLGTLANGTKSAVKMLSRTSRQGYREFKTEAQLLMIVHHRNLVSLVGYCDDAENMALIYEFMENGDLRHHLSGLDYLHNGCKPPIIHRDLKTSNILLNESMQAKIADFGLSKAFAAENDSHISTRPAGTPGYLDPEFQSSGNLNRKSDVYSFGVILFELITGYPAVIRSGSGNIHILRWVTPIIERGDIQSVVDPRLDGKFNVNSAWKLVETAVSCVPTTAVRRPDISRVLAELKECWDIEMALERSQRMGSSKIRSTEAFEMMSVELDDYESVPIAR
ncbi:hypothetical protein CDL15_Pgr005503 [Punica granatum]|uniref:Protein kinase domain-containing protein n=1 Tax=Punica granatum TaxID=22663 RepID=A0A218WVK1_PUNGR|nr:hypothetical protein CDL15_Pgr005503 [Punica granatum]